MTRRIGGPTITTAEMAALRRLAAGDTYDAAAAALGITYSTLSKKLSNVYRRLRVQNATHAIALLDDTRPGWRSRVDGSSDAGSDYGAYVSPV